MRWALRLLLTRGSGSSSGRSPLPGGGVAVATTAKRWKQPPVHARTCGRQWEANPYGGIPLGHEEGAAPACPPGNIRPSGRGRAAWRVRPCPRHVRRPRRQEADGAPGARDRLVGRACLLERRKYYGTGRGDGRTALRTGAKTADSRLGRWWGPWPGCESPTHPAPQVMGGKKNDGSPRARSGRSARERAASAGRSVLRLAGVG